VNGELSTRLLDPSSGQPAIVLTRMEWRGDGSKPAVLYSPGHGGDDTQAMDPQLGGAASAAAVAGYPVVSAGVLPPQWGGPAIVTRVGHQRTLAQSSTVGAKTGGVFLMGTSMGFLACCNWARQNKATVKGIIGLIYASDLEFAHDVVDGGIWASQVEAAFGGTAGYTAALPTYSPQLYGPTDLAGIPMLLIRSVDEHPLIVEMQADFVAAMQAASPGKVTEVLQTGGHSLTNLDTSVIKPFLDANA
jgi:hypothetical protein